MNRQEIKIQINNTNVALTEIKAKTASVMIHNPNIQLKGQSDALRELLNLYFEFARTLHIYTQALNDDLDKALKAVQEFKNKDQDLSKCIPRPHM